MMKYYCNPRKWAWGLIPLALPFLGAWLINSPLLVVDVGKKAAETLKNNDFDGINATMDGRDVILSGETHSKEVIDRAVKSVLKINGVRHVTTTHVKLVKPVVLNAPTINLVSGNSSKPILTGKWQEGVAKTLAVTIADKTYVLGTDSELTSNGNGIWTLKTSGQLADGTHDVVVSITDNKKASASDATKDELFIDTTAPNAPSVKSGLITKNNQPDFTGTWAYKDATALSVKLANKVYKLGSDKALSVDGKGNWSLSPAIALSDGVYDVTVVTADKLGNSSKVVKPAAITIDTTAPDNGTVFVSQGKDTTPKIRGKWLIAKGNTLIVEVAGKKYVLGKDKNLVSDDNGKWTLKIAKPLAAGKHGVTVTTSDAVGNENSMTSPGVIVIDKTGPMAPVVTSANNATTAPVIKGTWAEKAGNTLRVVVAGEVFALGRDDQLVSDGKGNWTLSLTQPMADGKHAVLVESADAFGNLSRSEKAAIVAVDSTKPDQPTVNKLASRSKNPEITGTWPENPKNTLSIAMAGKNYIAGKSPELTSDGQGNWVLKTISAMADGSYDIVATVTDQAGNKAAVTAEKAIIIDSTPPLAPTVTTVLTRNRRPDVTGTWESSDAVELKVAVAGQSYDSGNSGDIQIKGDHWKIIPKTDISDGVYNVVATTTDKMGNSSTDVGQAELVIDSTSPSTPTVRPVFGTNSKPPIGGSWQEDGQNSLSVSIDDNTYSLSTNGPLTSDGKGNWKLQLAERLKPGSYDVKVKVADRLGNQSNDTSAGEIWIKPPKVVEKKANPIAQAKKLELNCQREFTGTLAGQSIRFTTGKAVIAASSNELLSKLSNIAKACSTAKIVVSGHTDSRGSASYNKSLSEARASAVVDALVNKGVQKDRLKAVGYGETRPIAGNNTKQGRAKNRRIEFKVE